MKRKSKIDGNSGNKQNVNSSSSTSNHSPPLNNKNAPKMQLVHHHRQLQNGDTRMDVDIRGRFDPAMMAAGGSSGLTDDDNADMKLVASLEMTFVAGGPPPPMLANKPGKSKSRSPIALHQRCGIPLPTDEDGGDAKPHSSKPVKPEVKKGGKKVSTIATGRVGPLKITLRAGSGGDGPTATAKMVNCTGGACKCCMEDGGDGAEEEEPSSDEDAAKASGKAMMNGGKNQSSENGGGINGGGSSAVEIEQPADDRQPALVKIQARKVNCKSSDGELFVVDWYLMQQSKHFKRCWEEHRLAQKKKSGNGRSRKFTYNMEATDAATFRRVLEWLEQHDGMDDPEVRDDPATGDRIWFELTDFERRFFDQPVNILSNLLSAGKQLDIPSLYLFGCQCMAGLLKNKSPAEIRKMLGLENDLTSTDIAAIRRRHRKIKMRELKTASYANRMQQLQSQLNHMGLKNGPNGTVPPQVMAEQLMMASGRDILTG